MKEGLVSVIITTYHREAAMVRKCVESVQSQTYRKLEVILVDDNGTEADSYGIKELAESYQETDIPVIYIRNPVNCGAQISRNTGILRSEGEFIAFLDDDDLWLEKKAEMQVEAFKIREAGLVYCMGYQVTADQEGNVTACKPYNMSACFLPEVNFQDMLYGDYIGTTSQVMVRRKVLAACGIFDPDQPARQDYEMWIRISRRFRCIGVAQPLFCHIKHGAEQISKDGKKAFDGIRRVYWKYRKFAGYTSRCHFQIMMFRLCRRNGEAAGIARYGLAAFFYLILALLFDSRELRARNRIHSLRVNSVSD